MICIGCVETFYEHFDHISWLAGRTIKYNALRNLGERATRLLKSQKVSPSRFTSALGVHLSISSRNAASYGFKRLESPTHKCNMRFASGDPRFHGRYVAQRVLSLNIARKVTNLTLHKVTGSTLIEHDETDLESGDATIQRLLHEKDVQIEELRKLNEELRSLNEQLKDELRLADVRSVEMEQMIEKLKDDLILGTKTVHR